MSSTINIHPSGGVTRCPSCKREVANGDLAAHGELHRMRPADHLAAVTRYQALGIPPGHAHLIPPAWRPYLHGDGPPPP